MIKACYWNVAELDKEVNIYCSGDIKLEYKRVSMTSAEVPFLNFCYIFLSKNKNIELNFIIRHFCYIFKWNQGEKSSKYIGFNQKLHDWNINGSPKMHNFLIRLRFSPRTSRLIFLFIYFISHCYKIKLGFFWSTAE